jgi:hypothetical protein
VSINGPWWPELAQFPGVTRALPVVFPYPKTDIVRLDMAPPPGFAAAAAPPPVKLESALGTYALTVTAAEAGFHVERTLVLNALKVSPTGYVLLRQFFEDIARADRTTLSFRPAAAKP